MAASVAVLMLGTFTVATALRADLRGRPNDLILAWAEQNRLSPRAQRSAAIALAQMGRRDFALARLDAAEAGRCEKARFGGRMVNES